MMVNPYEAPQTNDVPLTIIQGVSKLSPELEVLTLGIAHCARAGRLYLLATGFCFVFLLCRVLMVGEYRNDPRLIITMTCFMFVSAVVCGWGVLENISGLLSLRGNLLSWRRSHIFSVCLHLCWVKVPLLGLALINPMRDFGHFFAAIDFIWDQGSKVVFIGVCLATVGWQTRGINALVTLLGIAQPRYTSMLYTLSGMIMVLALFFTAADSSRREHLHWYFVLVGVLALHQLAFARTYRQLLAAYRTGLALSQNEHPPSETGHPS